MEHEFDCAKRAEAEAVEAVRAAGVLLVPVASPPVFSLGFQRRLQLLLHEGTLRALHVTAAGDFAPKLRGSLLSGVGQSGVHGVTQRLVLNPKTMGLRPYYYVAAGEDDECADLANMVRPPVERGSCCRLPHSRLG